MNALNNSNLMDKMIAVRDILYDDFSSLRRRILFGESIHFKNWLINQGINHHDPITLFTRFIGLTSIDDDGKNIIIFEDWNAKMTVTVSELEKPINITNVTITNVSYNEDHKYRKQYVGVDETISISDLKSDLTIISKNKSSLFFNGERIVGGVLRNVAKKNVSKYFGAKIKAAIESQVPFKRGEAHAHSGLMVGVGARPNFFDSTPGPYVHKDAENLNPEAIKILDHDGYTLARWIYNNAKNHLPWITVSYEEFKNKVGLEDNDIIGALFCTKNYEAKGHVDDDRSDWALGYVYEEGQVEDGHFFYPEYGVAIEMSSNSMWFWLTQSVHGTARIIKSKGAARYTGVISLSEKTAIAIEKERLSK